MKVALIAPIALPVPPAGYGGTELVVHNLAEGLVALGHDVTLFASGDSGSSAHLAALYPRALGGHLSRVTYQSYEVAHVTAAMGRAREFDIIHDHTKAQGVLAARFCPRPVVTTVHNDFTPERRLVYGANPDHAYVAISEAQAQRMPELNFVGVVYNGLDLTPTYLRESKDDYLLFLGRFDEMKGAHTAARVALALDFPLVMAGRITDADRPYFEAEVAPHLDGVKRRYVGEVTGKPKWDLYAGARALLFPIQWDEPFGLVMIEAMACGTPVVATGRGSVGEVIEPGVSGVIVKPDDGLPQWADATKLALTLAPDDCRRHVQRRFTAKRMAEDYLTVYEQVLAG
jgi:glycosyltransferase involved in cell wall biosynthesis